MNDLASQLAAQLELTVITVLAIAAVISIGAFLTVFVNSVRPRAPLYWTPTSGYTLLTARKIGLGK